MRDRIRARGSTSAKERGADGDARSARTERAGGAGPTSAAGDDIVDVAGIARGGRVTAGRGGDRGRRGRVGALKARRAARDLPPATEVRSIQKFFTHRSVSTFDRVPFQLTGELFLYGISRRRRPIFQYSVDLALARSHARARHAGDRPRARTHEREQNAHTAAVIVIMGGGLIRKALENGSNGSLDAKHEKSPKKGRLGSFVDLSRGSRDSATRSHVLDNGASVRRRPRRQNVVARCHPSVGAAAPLETDGALARRRRKSIFFPRPSLRRARETVPPIVVFRRSRAPARLLRAAASAS